MKGSEFVDQLRHDLKADTDTRLSKLLGLSQARVAQWRQLKRVTPRQAVRVVLLAQTAILRSALMPVVEYFAISRCPSRGNAGYELFATSDGKRSEHPYRRGLKDELERHYGIYIFYDSRGRALYVGKAERQKLWSEMKSAFNRPRATQSVYRVAHPTERRKFKTAEEKVRQPKRVLVKLHELAVFFSAYKVEPALIPEIEAMLVRSFPNDLLNAKVEKFAGQKSR